MLLTAMVEDSRHVYLKSLPSPASRPFLSSLEQILGSRQVTDAYLVILALKNRATLLTFDSRIAAFSRSAGAVEVLI